MRVAVQALLALFATLMFAFGHAAIIVRDDSGNDISLDHAAKRIISLSPHNTELLFAAGAGDRVVAVVEYSDYPPAAKMLSSVGSASALDIERIAVLKPDLVVAWGSGNPKRQRSE